MKIPGKSPDVSSIFKVALAIVFFKHWPSSVHLESILAQASFQKHAVPINVFPLFLVIYFSPNAMRLVGNALCSQIGLFLFESSGH